MAAAIKAINAKIRSNKVLDYFCSTRKLLLPPADQFGESSQTRWRAPAKICDFCLAFSRCTANWTCALTSSM